MTRPFRPGEAAPAAAARALFSPAGAAPAARPARDWLRGAAPLAVVPLQRAQAPQPVPDDAELERRVEAIRAEAELEGLRAAQEKVEILIERYADGAKRLQEAARVARRPVAAEVVELALMVAREIIGRDPAARRELIEEALGQALASVTLDARVVLHVGAADAEYLRQRRPDVIESGVTLVVDDRIRAGGCRFESPNMIVDATIEARLAAARSALEAVLAHAPLAEEDEGC